MGPKTYTNACLYEREVSSAFICDHRSDKGTVLNVGGGSASFSFHAVPLKKYGDSFIAQNE